MLNNLITKEDALLAASVREGCQNSFSVVYDKYAPALLGIINKIVDDQQLAEDVLTQTFVNAWDQRKFCSASYTSLLNWLINLARKTAFGIVKLKKQKNQVNPIDVYESVKNNTTHNLGENENNIAFDLVYYKGLNCIEAATLLNISVDELKTRIRMTIKLLKENKVAC
ncbi:MAG: sigma factor [Bacteroidota bacterium]